MKSLSMLALVLGLTLSSCAHHKKSCCGTEQCKMKKEQCSLKKDGEKKECCKKGMKGEKKEEKMK
jgi:hypothetical protein